MTDDVELLKECDAGVKMGIEGIGNVMDDATDEDFKNLLKDYEGRHYKVSARIHEKLKSFGASEKEPNAFASSMSKMSTGMKMMMDNSDEKIADLMIDGCNMGIKSVSRYMNQYSGASRDTMDIANDVIVIEQNFMNDLRQYL